MLTGRSGLVNCLLPQRPSRDGFAKIDNEGFQLLLAARVVAVSCQEPAQVLGEDAARCGCIG